MRILPTAILSVLGALGCIAQTHEAPSAVFAGLDGVWSGAFIGYDETGRELYRIRVRQTYETISDTVQRVTVDDEMPDGTHVTGHGENTARRGPDGKLILRCVVEKSNGDRVEHDGRIVRGPDGHTGLIWYSRTPGRVETFREVVRREGDTTVYEINGMGRYGETLMLMHGRYEKVADAPGSRPNG